MWRMSWPPCRVQYVIAHELAHAHLRNGGRWEGDDPERAADALAAEWGFTRP
jgi:Zn-dependent peptidase ImmA (M78 family)